MPTKLADICRLVGGYAFKSGDFKVEGVPVIKIADVTGGGTIDYSQMQCVSESIASKASRFAPEPRDTLISMTGANVGKTARTGYSDPEARINQRVGRFVPHEGLGYSKDYIHYVVSSDYAYSYFSTAAYGSAQPNISGSLVESLPIPDFSAALANRIGDVLSSLDDKIELNRRMNETLEAMAQAIFRDWFVDFGPTRRKLEGATDPVTIMGGLVTDPTRAQELADLFPGTLGDDGLPEGWKYGQLGDVVVNVVDRCVPNDATRQRPYVPIDMITARSLTIHDSRPGSDAQSSLVAFRRDDILFGAMRPYFHKVALAHFDGTTRTTVFVLRPKIKPDLGFALMAINDDATIAYATQHSSGTTIPYAVWPGSLESMSLLTPPAIVREAYGGIIQPMLDRMLLSASQNRTLAATRDLLLPKLMSGEIRLGEAEEIVEAAQ